MGIEELINEYKKQIENNMKYIEGEWACEADRISGMKIAVDVLRKVVKDLQLLKSSLPTQQDKVVVKRYIADWYENNRGNLTQGLSVLAVSASRKNREECTAMEKLMQDGEIDLVGLLFKMKAGYAVEKEPLFIMPVPCMRNTLHYCLKDNGEISFRQGNAYKFNQDQLDKYFPEIKGFAVPVEEESE